MIADVIMPKLGESITEGTIIEWKKKIGDMIIQDETILEISTDKVDSEVPSPGAGKITEILYKVNDVVPVGEVIARIGGKGDPVKKIEQAETEQKKEESVEVPTVEKTETNEKKPSRNQTSKRFYSPLVRSIAKKESISFSSLISTALGTSLIVSSFFSISFS